MFTRRFEQQLSWPEVRVSIHEAPEVTVDAEAVAVIVEDGVLLSAEVEGHSGVFVGKRLHDVNGTPLGARIAFFCSEQGEK